MCTTRLNGWAFRLRAKPSSLRRAGLVKGGSYDNAIVLDERGVLNGSLRFPDEFVRHKALDLIGDLALTGLPLLGHVRAHAAGHAAHVRFATTLLATPAAWRIEPAGTADPQEAAGTVALPVAGSGRRSEY